jgi:aryl-alcohol dehydrogenase-like predicted oxidoreductase
MIERLLFGSFALADEREAARLLDAFVAAGGAALDLANVYRDGAAERAVGRWLGADGHRDEVVLYAKGCHPPSCSPELVAAEVEAARSRLEVDELDVFLLHRDDPDVPVERWAAALLAEVDAGRIGRIGVSNWTLGRTLDLDSALRAAGAAGLLAASNHFSLAEMVAPPWPGCLAADGTEVEALGAAGIELLAWSSVAVGYFAGRDSSSWDSERNRGRRRRAAELAVELGASPTQIALAYVLHQPEHVRPVIGTTSERHLAEAIAATDIRLTPDQLRWLEG